MAGNYRCRRTDPETGEECGKTFTTAKALATHQKAYVTRPCRFCGRLISNNGHTQHEQACTEKPEAFPWAVFADLVDDLVARTSSIPEGTVCVVTVSNGARFMQPPAALRFTATATETVITIPASLLTRPDQPARDRRLELGVTPADSELSTRPTRPRPPTTPSDGLDFTSIA